MDQDDSPFAFLAKVQAEAEKQAREAEAQHEDNQSARNVMIATINTPEALAQLYERYARAEEILPGTIVRWKPGFRNRTVSGPFVVIERLERGSSPRIGLGNTEEVGIANHLFMERADVRVAFIAPERGDDNFLMYWLDSQRLEPVR